MLINRLKGNVKSLAEKLYYNHSLENIEGLLEIGPRKTSCTQLGVSSQEWRDAVYVAVTEKKASSLCHARKLLRLSQRELGDAFRLTSQQISNFENGRSNITRQTELSMECLLLRAGKWDDHCKTMSTNPKRGERRVEYNF